MTKLKPNNTIKGKGMPYCSTYTIHVPTLFFYSYLYANKNQQNANPAQIQTHSSLPLFLFNFLPLRRWQQNGNCRSSVCYGNFPITLVDFINTDSLTTQQHDVLTGWNNLIKDSIVNILALVGAGLPNLNLSAKKTQTITDIVNEINKAL